jgi:hypothetical protein
MKTFVVCWGGSGIEKLEFVSGDSWKVVYPRLDVLKGEEVVATFMSWSWIKEANESSSQPKSG